MNAYDREGASLSGRSGTRMYDTAQQPTPGRERVAVVTHSHPSLTKGGSETAAYTLYCGLLALGVDAVFIAACPEDRRDKIVLGSGSEQAVFYDPRLYDHALQLATPEIMRRLVEAIVVSGATTVSFHHFMNFGINTLPLVAGLPGVRTFLTLHEFLAMCQNHGQMVTRPYAALCERPSLNDCSTCFPELPRQTIAIRRALAIDALTSLTGFIAPSRFLAKRYADWGLPPDRLAVVENGLLYPPQAVSPPRTAPDRTFVIGFFGQINPFKGVDVLLDAADLIEADPTLRGRVQLRVHGNIIGQPDGFTARFNAALAKHNFVSFHGPYNNSSVAALMADCDYIVVPSRWWENSPVVIQEAFSVGRPVICSGIGGMAEKVPHGVCGLNFRPGDARDFVHILEAAIQPETYLSLVRSVPKVVDAKQMAAHYLHVFDEITHRHHPAGQLARGEPSGRERAPGHAS